MKRQFNFRIEEELVTGLEEVAMEIEEKMKIETTRSDIARIAIKEYLEKNKKQKK